MSAAPAEDGPSSSTLFGVFIGLGISMVCAIALLSYALIKRRTVRMRERQQLEGQIRMLRHRRELVAMIAQARSNSAVLLTEEQVKALSRRTVTAGCPCDSGVVENTEQRANVRGHQGSTETCGICLGDHTVGDEVVDLPCSHTFHEACIVPWVKAHDKCPFCNRQISIALPGGEKSSNVARQPPAPQGNNAEPNSNIATGE
ncbi:hypothetical protein GGI07_002160 [Coemansia sp. Benny D115]|nr:hypothetical protein GGI07_002160 [Coemansia sp. Benny D115]